MPSPDCQEPVIDLRLWLRDTNRITKQQRRLLRLLADEHDADAIAAMYRVPPQPDARADLPHPPGSPRRLRQRHGRRVVRERSPTPLCGVGERTG